MANKSAENKFLLVSSVLVVLVGIKTVTSIIEQPGELHVKSERKVAAVPVSTASMLSKAPTQSAANLNFDCSKEIQKEVVVKGALVQIRGKGCKAAKDLSQISIVNKSNGYTASVFTTSDTEFLTDMIQLVEGPNQIFIQYQTSNGKKLERKLVVKSSHI